MAALFEVISQKLNPPKPLTNSLEGKTVLITGTSSGLGLEAAKKLAALNPTTLIITARNDDKAAIVKKTIEESLHTSATTTTTTTEIVPMILDMSSNEGIISFVSALKSKVKHLDGAILNAGTIQVEHHLSADNWEETIQVNAISTVLLGALLLPLLLASPLTTSPKASDRPHLNFVSSSYTRRLTLAQMAPFFSSHHPVAQLSEAANFPPGMLGGQTQYGRSKLILEYGMRHLATLPALQTNNHSSSDTSTTATIPKVLITSCCPGLCKSDLGRQYVINVILRVGLTVVFGLLARTSEQGSNIYLTGLATDETINGQTWRDDRVLEGGELLDSDEGRKFGDNVWSELRDVLIKADAGLKGILIGGGGVDDG